LGKVTRFAIYVFVLLVKAGTTSLDRFIKDILGDFNDVI